MRIRCPRCQAVQEAGRFCNNCGVGFRNVPPPNQPAFSNLPPRRARWKLATIILGICLFLGLASLIKESDSNAERRAAATVTTAATPFDTDIGIIGEKPFQSSWDGEVLAVKRYLRATLNDYESSEFVEWSPVSKVNIEGRLYWGVRLKLRAKNAFGAYVLRDTYYFIRFDEVVFSKGLSSD